MRAATRATTPPADFAARGKNALLGTKARRGARKPWSQPCPPLTPSPLTNKPDCWHVGMVARWPSAPPSRSPRTARRCDSWRTVIGSLTAETPVAGVPRARRSAGSARPVRGAAAIVRPGRTERPRNGCVSEWPPIAPPDRVASSSRRTDPAARRFASQRRIARLAGPGPPVPAFILRAQGPTLLRRLARPELVVRSFGSSPLLPRTKGRPRPQFRDHPAPFSGPPSHRSGGPSPGRRDAALRRAERRDERSSRRNGYETDGPNEAGLGVAGLKPFEQLKVRAGGPPSRHRARPTLTGGAAPEPPAEATNRRRWGAAPEGVRGWGAVKGKAARVDRGG